MKERNLREEENSIKKIKDCSLMDEDRLELLQLPALFVHLLRIFAISCSAHAVSVTLLVLS